MNGGKLFLRSMEEAGVKVVFGVPGETSLPVYHELTDSSMSLRHVLMKLLMILFTFQKDWRPDG